MGKPKDRPELVGQVRVWPGECRAKCVAQAEGRVMVKLCGPNGVIFATGRVSMFLKLPLATKAKRAGKAKA